jgi:hypothetical protein
MRVRKWYDPKLRHSGRILLRETLSVVSTKLTFRFYHHLHLVGSHVCSMHNCSSLEDITAVKRDLALWNMLYRTNCPKAVSPVMSFGCPFVTMATNNRILCLWLPHAGGSPQGGWKCLKGEESIGTLRSLTSEVDFEFFNGTPTRSRYNSVCRAVGTTDPSAGTSCVGSSTVDPVPSSVICSFASRV